jgi:hypothetical protein
LVSSAAKEKREEAKHHEKQNHFETGMKSFEQSREQKKSDVATRSGHTPEGITVR